MATRAIAPVRVQPGAAAALLAGNAVLLALVALGLAPLALLAAVLVPAAVAIVSRPQRGVLLLALLAPFSGLLLILPLPHAAAGWKEALVLATLLATFVAPSSARAAPGRQLPPWAGAVAGVLAVGLTSAVAVGGLQALIGLKVGFFYVLVAVIVWRCPLSARERDLLVSTIMGTGVLVAGIGVLQQVLGAARLNELGYEYNTTIRFTGNFLRSFSTFNQPFGFGFYVALSLLVGIPQVFVEPRRWRNRMFVLAMPILGLGLLSSFVRGAWLALGVGVLYLGSRRYKALLLVIPFALVAMAFLPSDLSTRAFSATSSQQRTELWVGHVGEVVQHPAGTGIGSTGAASEKVAVLTKSGQPVYQPDNYYFKTLVEVGVLGVWFLVLLLVSAFGSSRAAAERLSGTDAALADSAAAMVIAAAAAAMVATYFEIFPMDVFFWLLLAVVATCRQE